jgi:transcriptional regulator with XRE-family HTH domain
MVNVKDLRERHGLTRQQFADLFCIPVRTVQSWELGERACPYYIFRMMDELLQFYLVSGVLEGFKKGEGNDSNS